MQTPLLNNLPVIAIVLLSQWLINVWSYDVMFISNINLFTFKRYGLVVRDLYKRRWSQVLMRNSNVNQIVPTYNHRL